MNGNDAVKKTSTAFWEDWDMRRVQQKESPDVGPYPKTTYYPAPSKYVSRCTHKGNVLIFEQGNLRVYGGGSSRGASLIPGGLIIDLAGFLFEDDVKVSGFSCPHLLAYTSPRSIVIPWRDGKTLSWPRGAWKGLVEDLQAEAKKHPLEVLVACMGGHGRTGTALAILSHWAGVIPPGKDPIQWLRSIYCF